MDFPTFYEKLKELNPFLYVDLNHVTYATNKVYGSSGIYLKGTQRELIKMSGLEDAELSSQVKDWNAAQDDYVGWVTHGVVPEGDKFDENGRHVFNGWRTIVKRLVNQGITTKEKAKLVFGWEESTYDRLNYSQRVEFEKCLH